MSSQPSADKPEKKQTKTVRQNNSARADRSRTNRFSYTEGTIPILVTAPHYHEHIRRGKLKFAEPMTGDLAATLQQLCGVHTLVTAGKQSKDSNFIKRTRFKDKIARICQEKQIALVIDLHQLAPHRPFHFAIGTNDGTTTLGLDHDAIVTYLEEQLSAFAASTVLSDTVLPKQISEQPICTINPNNAFGARHQHCIARHCAEALQTPAIQLEINTKLAGNIEQIGKSLQNFITWFIQK